MAAPFDPYQTLGVSRSASADDIRRSFRRLARKYHPDVNPDDPRSVERFKEVSRANEVLSDPNKRRLFDEFGEMGLREGFDAQQARAYQSRGGGFAGGSPFGGGSEFGDLGDMFGDLGSFFGGRRPARTRGQDVNATLRVPFVEALRGATRRIVVPKPDVCPACQGAVRARNGCVRCGGAGVVETQHSLQIRIPPGSRPESVLRLGGQGGTGPRTPGDLLLTLEVESHRYYSFDGDDVVVELPLALHEALLGTTVSVPTADGDVNLRVPERTQPGTRLRLRGKGGIVRGRPTDLFARIALVLPGRIGERERDAIAALEAAYERPVRANWAL